MSRSELRLSFGKLIIAFKLRAQSMQYHSTEAANNNRVSQIYLTFGVCVTDAVLHFIDERFKF